MLCVGQGPLWAFLVRLPVTVLAWGGVQGRGGRGAGRGGAWGGCRRSGGWAACPAAGGAGGGADGGGGV